MKKQTKSVISELAKRANKIKVSKRLDSLEDATFFKKKMEKGEKMLATAGVPKS
ncbi:MAG TPA: hypothetical protein VFE57_13415 [Cyclobacteriaceae bacterium]|jgi:hypothetical protein|nr:hypothetical protein [Cyclobacteriaceae bacterium]